MTTCPGRQSIFVRKTPPQREPQADGMEAKAFEKGDSNRCRNAYEKVLHNALQRSTLAPHKKNKCDRCARTETAATQSWRVDASS